jgi:ABC-type glycerol-3-phosphate transport system substrate-binding protein
MNTRGLYHEISRRGFLRGAAGAAGVSAFAGLLSGCASPTGGATTASQAQSVQELIEVYGITPASFADMGMRTATDIYNEQIAAGGKRMVLEESPDGWETKALAMVRDNEVRWSASAYSQFDLQWGHIQMGLVQPIDDLLAASSVSYAQDYENAFYYPKIAEVCKLDGKTYFIPMKLNIFMTGYRQDYLEAAGYEALPETWDEFEVMLEKMKAALEPDVALLAVRTDIFRTLGIAFTTFVEEPYDENYMLKINSEEFLDCIKMFKGWFDKGYTNLALMQDPIADWQKGKVAIGFDSHSWIRLGRSVWGNEVIQGALPPKTDASNPLRTWIHVDSAFVFANAPYPQEALDWLLSILGPEGEPADTHWAGTMTFSGMPVHKNQFDKLFVEGEASPELRASYDAVPGSRMVPMEAGRYIPIINAKLMPWMQRYWGGEVEAEVAVQNAMDEIEQEVEKQIAS